MGVNMPSHEPRIHAPLITDKHASLLDLHSDELFIVEMVEVGGRIRQRYEELGLTQKAAAKACGCSPARFGNYVIGSRKPDIETLARIAGALRTTSDWLLGLSEAAPVDTKAVILRLLELEGMPPERAEMIAQVAQTALQALAALGSEGDAQTRALLAAQTAWQLRSSPKPS